MKIPFMPVHILRNKTLDKKVKDAKTETRNLSDGIISNLLFHNSKLVKQLKDLHRRRN